MSALNIEQNTQEWHEVRQQHLGASDAAIIMGVCKFKTQDGRHKTPLVLYKEKLGFETNDVDNFATRFGKENESVALKAYEEMVDDHFEPVVVFHKDPEYSFMMASLDGLNANGTKAVEIKNPGKEDHETAKRGEVPVHYYPQLQHQMDVQGLDNMDYFSFYKGEGVIVHVQRDDEYLKGYKKKAKEFWNCVETLTEPPLTEFDYIEQDDTWEEKADQLWLIKQNKKALEAQEKMLEKELKELCQGRNSRAGDYKYTFSTIPGRVDYKSIPEIKDIDLDQYRHAATTRCTLSRSSG